MELTQELKNALYHMGVSDECLKAVETVVNSDIEKRIDSYFYCFEVNGITISNSDMFLTREDAISHARIAFASGISTYELGRDFKIKIVLRRWLKIIEDGRMTGVEEDPTFEEAISC